MTAAFPGVAVVEAPVPAAGAVLVVKPADVADAARAVADAGTQRVLSVAAGVTTKAIEAALDRPLPVVRAMPNTPALIGAGAAAISPGSRGRRGRPRVGGGDPRPPSGWSCACRRRRWTR